MPSVTPMQGLNFHPSIFFCSSHRRLYIKIATVWLYSVHCKNFYKNYWIKKKNATVARLQTLNIYILLTVNELLDKTDLLICGHCGVIYPQSLQEKHSQVLFTPMCHNAHVTMHQNACYFASYCFPWVWLASVQCITVRHEKQFRYVFFFFYLWMCVEISIEMNGRTLKLMIHALQKIGY